MVSGHCTGKTVRQWLLVFLLQNFKKKRQCDVDLDCCNLPMHFPRSPALWWDITLITIFLWRHLFGFLISTSSVKSVALLAVLVLCSFYELKCKIDTDIWTFWTPWQCCNRIISSTNVIIMCLNWDYKRTECCTISRHSLSKFTS